jgi:sec-independent protein translocase protein TatB
VFGISGPEFIVLAAVAAVVLGPERLPEYAQQLGRLVREMRRMAQGATAQVRSEMGPEFEDIDWRKLDPRQYDPRRIVREALADTFDPDDPLGLREADKPVSPGAPRAWGAPDDEGRRSSGATAADQAGGTQDEPQADGNGRRAPAAGAGATPPFDLDAT